MKKVAITVFGVLALAGSANAQGAWYTSYATWHSLFPKRLMGLSISTLLITFIAAAAHADDVLTLGTAPTNINGASGSNPSATTFVFSHPSNKVSASNGSNNPFSNIFSTTF